MAQLILLEDERILRRLYTQMNRLRSKVKDATGPDLPIKTLRNEGYKFYAAVEVPIIPDQYGHLL